MDTSFIEFLPKNENNNQSLFSKCVRHTVLIYFSYLGNIFIHRQTPWITYGDSTLPKNGQGGGEWGIAYFVYPLLHCPNLVIEY